MTYLKGYRTYIIGFLVVVLAGLRALDYITEPVYQNVLGLLAGAGLYTLRGSIK